MNAVWATLPIAAQAVATLVDEFHFHRARRLPRWERIGHPLDTVTVLMCYALVLAVDPTTKYLHMYVALAVFSCLFITKDEFVHSTLCGPVEQWLHSVLFVLHPVVLASVGWFWLTGATSVLLAGFLVTSAFCGYQVVYWNFTCNDSREKR